MARFLPILVVLIIGGVSGFGLGFIAGGDNEHTGARNSITDLAQIDDARATASEVTRDTPRDSGPDTTPSVDFASFENVDVDVPTGDGRIHGVCKTATGEPLPGVRVRAVPSGRPEGEEWVSAHEADLEEYLGQQARFHHWTRALYGQAISDSQGRYAITGLADHQFRVRVDKLDGYELSVQPRSRVKPDAEVNITGRKVHAVEVVLALPGGERPEKASILAKASGGSRSHSWTRDDPSIDLRPGLYQVSATVGEDLRAKPTTVTVRADGSTDPVHLTLEGRIGIRGKVTAAAGDQIQHGTIRFLAVAPDAPLDGELLQQQGQHNGRYHDGEFSIMDLSPGHYMVGFGRNWNRIDVLTMVEVTDGIVELDLEVPAVDLDQCIVVDVQDATGTPVAQVNFQIHVQMGHSSRSSGVNATQRGDGTHLVHPDEHSLKVLNGEEAGDVTLITFYGQMQQVQPLSPASWNQVSIQFDDPAMLTVQLAGYVGSGYEGRINLSIRPYFGDDSDPMRRHARSHGGKPDGEGVVSFASLQPGSHELTLNIGGGRRHSWGHSTVATQVIELRAGDNQASMTVPELYSVTIIVEDAKENTQVQMRSTKRGVQYGGRSIQLSEDGSAKFEGLAAGDYRVHVYGSGMNGQMVVSVPGRSQVTFEAAPINAMEVTIQDSGGYFTEIGLDTGDLIIGLDGVEFEDQKHMTGLIREAHESEEQATFLVLRGNSTISVTFDPKSIQDHQKNGGHYSYVPRP